MIGQPSAKNLFPSPTTFPVYFFSHNGNMAPVFHRFLLAHRDWEAQYLEQTLGAKLSLTSAAQTLSNGSTALLWKFSMPKRKNPGEQIYLTTVSGKQVIILNGTQEESKLAVPDRVIQRLLLDTLSTLQVSSRPVDVLKLQESIRRNHNR